MASKWWEKTVEYRFVLMAAKHGDMFAAPLDGNEEKAGDTIFSFAKTWVLIEFKRDASCVVIEERKFENYQRARAALHSLDGHHYLVYGEAPAPSSTEPFDLCMLTFFSRVRRESFSEIVSSGIALDPFNTYIARLVALKKSTSGGKAKRLEATQYMLVAGVSDDNRVVACMSLGEFDRTINLTPEPTLTRYFGSPSM
jgi:hypothetical protein